MFLSLSRIIGNTLCTAFNCSVFFTPGVPQQEAEPSQQDPDPVPSEQAQPKVLRLLREARSLGQGEQAVPFGVDYSFGESCW